VVNTDGCNIYFKKQLKWPGSLHDIKNGQREINKMKYQVIDRKDTIIIRISGDTRNNEALLVKRLLLPYFQKIGIMVIIDLKHLKKFEPGILVGILNGIRKEVALLKGELKLCSLQSEIDYYLKENRLDRVFQVYKNEQAAIMCLRREPF
jgi:anti-anti-sigma factor